jgi:phosphohistidine swiveling domain-containing protein
MNEQEVRQGLKENKEWYHKGFPGQQFTLYAQAISIAIANAEKIPYAPTYLFAIFHYRKHGYFDCFWDERDLAKNRTALIEKSISDLTYIKDFFEQHEKAYKTYVALYDSLGIPGSYSADIETLQQLHHLMKEQAKLGYIVDNFLTTGKDWLVEAIESYLGDKAMQETIKILTAPGFTSFVSVYEKSLHELAGKVAQGKSIEAEAEKIAHDFIWLRANYSDYAPLTAQDVVAEAGQEVEKMSQHHIASPQDNQKAREMLYADLGVSKGLKNIVEMAQLLAHVQDRRKECVLRHNFYCLNVLDRLAAERAIDKELLFSATAEELFDFLETGKLDEKTLSYRAKKPYAILYFNGKAEFTYGDDVAAVYSPSHYFEHDSEVKEIRGTSAFQGHVKGIVRVLLTHEDMKDFKEGEILVTNQTTPEFVPAMKKAVAVVTDQGGITSHASIVSRELQVPCVVGTKVSTKVLQTGDMVEVDAKRGVVTILQKV